MKCELCKRDIDSEMPEKICGFCEKLRTDELIDIEMQLGEI